MDFWLDFCVIECGRMRFKVAIAYLRFPFWFYSNKAVTVKVGSTKCKERFSLQIGKLQPSPFRSEKTMRFKSVV